MVMKKGKGYPEHVKNTDKGFGEAIKDEAMGKRSLNAALAEWPDDTWEFPEPKKKSRKSTMYI